ncbi:MAG TPA: aminoglycoside phosphotransferase family protein [Chloroflexota bacterium]|nr:aminoglycoside phosphotransferase family protein [Chloroflexota bacterium]
MLATSDATCERTPQSVLEEGLAVHLDRPVRIVEITSQPLNERSTHPIERLSVRLETGDELPVIFKRLDPAARPGGGRQEVLIYQRVVPNARFGAPVLYASLYNHEEAQYWLFLEEVRGWTLDDGDWEDYLAAARSLGRLHGTYLEREAELRQFGCLPELGRWYYETAVRTARRNLHLAGAEEALVRFDGLMVGFNAVVRQLVRQPRALVHGDIFVHNILIQSGGRIRLVDWELAAIGLPQWELSRLLSGWGTDKRHLVEVYLDEYQRAAGSPVNLPAFWRTLSQCEIVNPLLELGWSVEYCRDESKVSWALRKLESIWRQLDGEATSG